MYPVKQDVTTQQTIAKDVVSWLINNEDGGSFRQIQDNATHLTTSFSSHLLRTHLSVFLFNPICIQLYAQGSHASGPASSADSSHENLHQDGALIYQTLEIQPTDSMGGFTVHVSSMKGLIKNYPTFLLEIDTNLILVQRLKSSLSWCNSII